MEARLGCDLEQSKGRASSDLYQAYQQVHRATRRPRFEVTLERDGVQVTKTYLIQ